MGLRRRTAETTKMAAGAEAPTGASARVSPRPRYRGRGYTLAIASGWSPPENALPDETRLRWAARLVTGHDKDVVGSGGTGD